MILFYLDSINISDVDEDSLAYMLIFSFVPPNSRVLSIWQIDLSGKILTHSPTELIDQLRNAHTR